MAVQPFEKSDSTFRTLIEASLHGIVVHRAGIIVYANPAIAQMLGFAAPGELLGLPVIERVHPDDRAVTIERIRRLQAGEPVVPFNEVRLVTRDGATLHATVSGIRVELGGAPCVVAVCRDITDERRLQARLVEADRMVALGTLSAGIAHEINNPLTYLLLHLDVCTALAAQLRPLVGGEALALVERLTGSLAITQDGATRVRDIVRDLRIFARTTGDERAPLIVRDALERALSITAHELRGRAELVTDLGDAPRVVASEGRLTQVFVNLLINAAHALDERPDHRVEVRLWGVPGEPGEARIAIRDTGHGIAPEHLPRIFEPFFTTKPVGDGTGLGLSIVHGIVTSLGGRISVSSRPGEGSTFTVALPGVG